MLGDPLDHVRDFEVLTMMHLLTMMPLLTMMVARKAKPNRKGGREREMPLDESVPYYGLKNGM